MLKVFVSYKSEDRSRVRPLVDALTAEGFAVWWDAALTGGGIWRAEIQQELDAAACVIVVWSELSASESGSFVHDEASRALRRGVYLPVGIDPVEPPLGFGEMQVLPLAGWRGDRADLRFVDVIAAVRAKLAGALLPPRQAPSAARRKSRWALAAALAAVTVAGGVALLPRAALCRSTAIACSRSAPPNSIAVLPFDNLSPDRDQVYFADGLSEELLSALAGIDTLQVAARTSSFRFKDRSEGSRAIADKLGVAFILDGSVRRSGDTVRVSAQLVEAATGFERWSATYDRNLRDVFAVQRGIAEAVVSALKVRLGSGAVAALRRAATASVTANDAFLRGRVLLNAGAGEPGIRAALAQFNEAAAADPGYAEAHAARARVLLALANGYLTDAKARKQTYDDAEAAARRSVELAPDMAESQASLAGALLYGRFDVAGARRAYARALAGGGGKADILLPYGLFACRTASVGPGLAALQRAVVLDPLNPRASKSLGLCLVVARRYAEATTALRRALTLNPAIAGVHSATGDALLLQGRLDDAAREYTLEPVGYEKFRGQAIVLARRGDLEGSNAALAAMVAGDGDSTAYQQAEVHAQRREESQTIAALDRAFATHDAGVLMIGSDPLLDPVRASQQFKAMSARLQ